MRLIDGNRRRKSYNSTCVVPAKSSYVELYEIMSKGGKSYGYEYTHKHGLRTMLSEYQLIM